MGLTCLNQHRWLGGVIPYAFDQDRNIPAHIKTVIVGTMKRWERLTGGCIHFVPWRNETDHVWITTVGQNSTSAGCVGRRTVESTHVRIGGRKTFTLGGHDVTRDDYPGGVRHLPHELGHIIGLEHEHYRTDSRLAPLPVPPPPTGRRRFIPEPMITISARQGWDNVEQAKSVSVPVGMYDMQSIMHYECPTGWHWSGPPPGVAPLPVFGLVNVPTASEVVMGTWRPSICDIYTVRSLYSA